MKHSLIFSLLTLLLTANFAIAQPSAEAEQSQYVVTLLRAAPGKLPELIDIAKARKTASDGNMIIMRHSQGDHWDLMLLAPAPKAPSTTLEYQALVDFQHDFLSRSQASWDQIQELAVDTGLFHIEMFQAARGQYAGLLKQRIMENDYLTATQRNANLIFETQFGSDVDIFTLGFHSDLTAFATDPKLPESVFEKAATDAGFKSRGDIGFYLREFLVGHQDTLATQVK
ncbi:hypothetical protein [Arenicella xantha]|nr:hypothetical protein [Arenicella xantha]